MRLPALLALLLTPVCAQEIRLAPSFEELTARAEEYVDVTLDSHMLKLASQFLSGSDKDEAKTKRALAGLENITVRRYQFAREGDYSPADLDSIRAQLKEPDWSKIVGVRSKTGENADIYLRLTADQMIGGVVIVSAQPRELTFVSIAGKLDLAQLADLGGKYHIPEFEFGSLSLGIKGDK